MSSAECFLLFRGRDALLLKVFNIRTFRKFHSSELSEHFATRFLHAESKFANSVSDLGSTKVS